MTQAIVVEFFASVAIWLLFIGLGILWVIDGKIKKEQVVHALFACLFAYFVAIVIKHFFPTLRPYVINGGVTNVFILPTGSAFPSEHTVIAFALSVTVFLHDRKVGWWFLVTSLLIGAARVAANVHYPIDIVGGAFLGTLVAIIVDKSHFLDLVNKLSPRGKGPKRS